MFVTNQTSVEEKDIAWLAGFFDGEGSLYFSVERKTGVIQPRWQLVNTNKTCAENSKNILSAILGREFRWQPRPPKNSRYLFQYLFRAKNHGEMQRILEAMLPYLSGKLPQAKLMLEYLAIKPGRGGRFRAEHYEFVERLKEMNRPNYKVRLLSQRETKRLAPNEDDVIVQSMQQCIEAAEMTARLQ